MLEDIGLSDFTGQGKVILKIKKTNLFWNHSPGCDTFYKLTNNSNDFKVTLMKSLLINNEHAP